MSEAPVGEGLSAPVSSGVTAPLFNGAGSAATGATPDAIADPGRGLTGAAIVGLGAALGERVVGNDEITERLSVDNRWIESRTGVIERRFALPGETVSTYASRASVRALAAAGHDPAALDLVLVATMSHEHLTPSASALVAEEIGATRAGAIDLNAACTGFVSGLALAAAQIEAGRARSVLVVGADILSRITDRDDRSTAGLFADGAGAVVLAATSPPTRIGSVILGADGGKADLIRAPRDDGGLIRMKGPDTFKVAIDRLSEVTLQALEAAGRTLDQVDVFAYHQANSRIITAVGERLGLRGDRVIDCVPRYGNTSAASIPIALAEADAQGMLADGTLVLMAAFGGGLTWGGAVVEWGIADRGQSGDEA